MQDKPSGLPDSADVEEVLGFVPQLEAYFRRAQNEMPDALREIFAAHGLTARHGAVIAQLATGPPVTVTVLARRLGSSLSTVSELVGDLARADLVSRREDPANRRSTLVTIDEDRRPTVETFVARRSRPLLAVLDRLTPEDRRGFARGLAAWAAEIDRT